MESLLLHSFNSFSNDSASTNFTLNSNNYQPGLVTHQSASHINSGLKYVKADMVKTVISRIALDASLVEFKHLKLDKEGNQTEINSELIDRLSFKANIDQSGRAFVYDLVWSLLDEGVIAAVPVETTKSIYKDESFDVLSIRVGKIVQWYIDSVRIRCYNEQTGLEQEIVVPKNKVAIIESPLLEVLKGENQTLKLLKQKLNVINSEDKKITSGKINGFIQFPYQTNTIYRKKQADKRRQELEDEMSKSVYGLATLDANEKYISTGGGVSNNTLEDIRNLQQDYYDQIGITENVIKGTASPSELNLYYHRLIDPVIQAVVDAFNMVFITKTGRTQGQRIMFFRDPFKLLPVESLAQSADLFSRNAILTPNEVRAFIGKSPHPSPLANQLFNRNIADANQAGGVHVAGQDPNMNPENQNGMEDFGEEEELEIYEDGQGGYVDAEGNPIELDENGEPILY